MVVDGIFVFLRQYLIFGRGSGTIYQKIYLSTGWASYFCVTPLFDTFLSCSLNWASFPLLMVRQHIPMRHIPIATFTHATFTHRRHLPIASIRYDAWSIRYLIVVAYGYLSRENWDLIEAMGKCHLWVNVAWVNVAMDICRMGICRLTWLKPNAKIKANKHKQ